MSPPDVDEDAEKRKEGVWIVRPHAAEWPVGTGVRIVQTDARTNRAITDGLRARP